MHLLLISNLYLVTVSIDGDIRVWDFIRCLHVLTGHKLHIYFLSTNGKNKLISSDTKIIRIWDINTWLCCQIFEANVINLKILSETKIYTWTQNSFKVINIETGQELVTYCPNTFRLYTISETDILTIHLVSKEMRRWVITDSGVTDTHNNFVTCNYFSNNMLSTRNKIFFSGTRSEYGISCQNKEFIITYDLLTNKVQEHKITGRLQYMVLISDSHCVCVLGYYKRYTQLAILNLESLIFEQKFDIVNGFFSIYTLLPDTRVLIYIEGKLHIWDWLKNSMRPLPLSWTSGITSLTCLRDRRIVCGLKNGDLKLLR